MYHAVQRTLIRLIIAVVGSDDHSRFRLASWLLLDFSGKFSKSSRAEKKKDT